MLNRLKNLVNLRNLKRIASVIGISCVILFLSVKGPQFHANFIRNKVGGKVVTVLGDRGGGTGFHVKSSTGKTYIVTNGHVCLLANENDQVYIKKGLTEMYRRVVYRHSTHDLCLVEGLPGIEGLSLGNYPDLGEVVALVGHPALRPLSIARGEIIGSRRISLIFGVNLKERNCIGKYYDFKKLKVKADNESMTPDEAEAFLWMYFKGAKSMCYANSLKAKMLNGISYGGNSGSPVVNFWGNVTGVLFAGGRQVTDSYVVPLYYLKNMLENF